MKKNKKIINEAIVMLALFSFVFVCLMSCTNNKRNIDEQTNVTTEITVSDVSNNETEILAKKYEIMEMGPTDCVLEGVNHSNIFLKQEAKRVVEYTDKYIVIKYKGEEYNVKYHSSFVGSIYYGNDYEEYIQNFGNLRIDVLYSKLKDQIVSVSIKDRDYFTGTDLIEKTQEECIQIAKNFLSKYVDDISSYQANVIVVRREVYGDCYWIYFVRMIGDLETQDQASVHVTKYGEIIGYNTLFSGSCKDVELPNEKTMIEINKQVYDKLDEMYEKYKENHVSYQLKRTSVCRYTNGQYGLLYNFEVTIEIDGEMRHEGAFLVVLLD